MLANTLLLQPSYYFRGAEHALWNQRSIQRFTFQPIHPDSPISKRACIRFHFSVTHSAFTLSFIPFFSSSNLFAFSSFKNLLLLSSELVKALLAPTKDSLKSKSSSLCESRELSRSDKMSKWAWGRDDTSKGEFKNPLDINRWDNSVKVGRNEVEEKEEVDWKDRSPLACCRCWEELDRILSPTACP